MNRNSIFFVGLVVMALVLSACSSAPAAQAAVSDLPPGCLGSADSALTDLNCREVIIGVENAYLPFNYVIAASGEAGGWDYEAWREICTRLHCTPVFQEVAWEGMIQGVADRQVDVAADGITITADRSQIVDFSDGYLAIQQRLLVRKGETRFARLEDFAGDAALVLGTQANTTNYQTAAAVLPETRIKAFEQMPFAIQALISGDVDAVIIDETVGMGYLGENAGQLELVGPAISSDQLGFAFPKGSDLTAPVNQALAAMRADGTLESLNQRFFGPDFKITQDQVK